MGGAALSLGMPSVLQPLATNPQESSDVSEIMFSLLCGLSTRVVGVEGQNGAPVAGAGALIAWAPPRG